MSAQSAQGMPSRKRKRQAVVCTECRRRKIACDRNTPCTQCIQSNSACTYYNSYLNGGGGGNNAISYDQDSLKPTCMSTSSTASATATATAAAAAAAAAPRRRAETLPHLAIPTTAAGGNSCSAFAGSLEAGAENLPNYVLVDAASSGGWFDAANLCPMPQSFSKFLDMNAVPFPDSSTSGMHKLGDMTPMTETTLVDSANAVCSPPPKLGKFFFEKARLYGPIHWMTLCQKYEKQGLFNDVAVAISNDEGYPILQECKRLSRALKDKTGADPLLLSRPLREFMPRKDISDRLVRLYLRTFESVLRILHIPSFQLEYAQYWNDPSAASETFELLLLLVVSIGTCFDQDPTSSNGTDGPSLHDKASGWILAAHVRLATLFRKKHLTICGVQTHCLLVLALLTNTKAVGGDLFWVTTASLLQRAMAIGLHLEPSKTADSPFEAEIRRRLWATVLELTVQGGLDSGTVLGNALETCEAPSNLDDCQIGESIKSLPDSQPETALTQSSIQRVLVRSLPIRLKIAGALSQFGSQIPYESAQRMGAELTAVLRETSDLIDSFVTTPPSGFQIQLQDLLARRFLLLLHSQFAYKAGTDVNFHYSRAVCLECSQLLLSTSRHGSHDSNGKPDRACSSSNGTPLLDDYGRLRLYGDGLFKNVLLFAAVTVCAEILLQFREDSSPSASSLSRHELLQVIGEATSLTRRRIVLGETNVKAHVFLACVLAKTGVSRRRSQLKETAKTQPDQALVNAARRSLQTCRGILEKRLGRISAQVKDGLDMTDSSRHINFLDRHLAEDDKDDELGQLVDRAAEIGSPLGPVSESWSDQLANVGDGWID